MNTSKYRLHQAAPLSTCKKSTARNTVGLRVQDMPRQVGHERRGTGSIAVGTAFKNRQIAG